MSTFTMRLPEEDYEALQAMSLLTGQPMAELARDAIVDKLTGFARSGDLQQIVDAETRTRQAAVAKLRARVAGRHARPRKSRSAGVQALPA